MLSSKVAASDDLRIVLFEDSPTDALMVRAALAERLGAAQCVTASTLAAGLSAIDAFAPMVALVDLGLPDSDGLDTLRAVGEHSPLLPIVVLTGMDDDRIGQLAISGGAQDYLVKGKADAEVLARCIRYAIERKHVEGELRRSHELLDRIFENNPDCLFVKSADDLAFVRVNPACEELLGRSASELVGKTEGDLFPGPSAEASLANDHVALADFKLLDLPVESVETRGGELRLVHSRRIPLHGEHGNSGSLLTIYEDITERESYKAEQLFRLLVDSVQEYAIYMLDPEGRISSWNAGAERIKGYGDDEVLGQHVSIFYTPHDVAKGRPAHSLHMARVYGRFEEDAWRIRKDGTRFWANDVITPVHDSSGLEVGFANVTRDLSEQRRAERRMMDLVPDAAIACDLERRVTFWNAGAESTYGWSADEVLGRPLEELMPAVEGAAVAGGFLDDIAAAGQWEGELRHRTKDGRIITIEARWSLRADADGTPTGLFGTNRDITARRATEDALEESRALLADLVDIAPDAIIGTDGGQTVTLFNQGAETMFGFTAEEVLGHPLDLLLPEEATLHDRGLVEEFSVDHERSKKMAVQQRTSGRRKDSTLFPVEASISRLQRGAEFAFTAIVRDMTARDAAEMQLAHQAEELSRSNAELEEFAYVASHDLSEPLRTVAGFVQLLAQRYEGKLDPDADEFIGFTLDGVKRMQTLIGDLLTYSRVSRLEYLLEPVDCGTIVHDVAEELGAEDTIDWSQLPIVNGDEGQLRRVFQNLISNGLKFIPPGRIAHVKLSAVAEDGWWHFSVADNGIGIADKYHERIFKMFQRLHSADKYPGTGIGLAICQRIIGRHGGRLWLESVPDEGTTFHFTIPTTEATP
jgi:PAS domain S-box-containing protein